MSFVIYNPEKNVFLKHQGTWCTTLKGASKFSTMEKVQNYMTNNYSHVVKDVPADVVQILSTDNLTAGFVSAVVLDDATAQAEFEWLKNTLTLVLAESEKLVALPRYYGKLLNELEQETQDILHKIEFTNENVVSGFKRYKQLQDVRQRRRKVKDSMEFATLLLSSGLLTSMRRLQLSMDKMQSDMEVRKYNPRVLTELFDVDNDDDE